MNNNSAICEYIRNHLDSWQDDFRKLGISIRREGNLALFYYTKDNFRDEREIKMEANGIIINTDTLDVVCFPFGKINSYNNASITIDWDTAFASEKLDGIQVNLWYNKDTWNWEVSTNKVISGLHDTGKNSKINYKRIFESAKNRDSLDFCVLNKDCTYVFELVSPEIKKGIAYSVTQLYHTGTRYNNSGEETHEYIGISKSESIRAKTLDNCMDLCDRLNLSFYGEVEEINHEGYVVTDKYFNRIKLQTKEWKLLRYIESGDNEAKDYLISLLRNGMFVIGSVCDAYPHLAHVFKYYDYKVEELNNRIRSLCEKSLRYYEKYGLDRLRVKLEGHPLQEIVAVYTAGKVDLEDVATYFNTRTYRKLIPDYVPLEEIDFKS